MEEKQYISVEEVAQMFEVQPSTIYRLVQGGELPGFKVGGQWRFSPEMLNSWVADKVTIEKLKIEDQKNGHEK